jgi:hypothetical protein
MNRRRLALLVTLVAAAGALWWALQLDAPPPPSGADVRSAAPPESEPPPPVTRREEPPPVAEVVDAGAGDAGAAPAADRRPLPDVEAYMRKWRDALAPLLKAKGPTPPTAIVAEREAEPDAGCVSGVRSFWLGSFDPVDYLVVVDTSGSMIPSGVSAASDWIGQLEFTLATANRDYRLLVLAEPAQLQLGDAGIVRRRIGSHDALDVMIASATGQPRWLSMLRDRSELRIVLITDDRPTGDDPSAYQALLAQTIGDGHRFTFSIMGGFEPARVGQDAPSTVPCTGRGPDRRPLRGEDPGVTYQQLALATGGGRASLCSASSRAALVDAVSGGAPRRQACVWPIEPDAKLFDVRAYNAHSNDYLVREYSSAGCPGTRRSYLREGPLLSMCPDSCEALKHDGYEEVRARVECGP